MDEIIIDSIRSHLGILSSIFNWILVFSVAAGLGIYRDNKPIDIPFIGLSLDPKIAYNYILGFYVVINFVVLLLLFRINELICQSTDLVKTSQVVKIYPWILNPFSDFTILKVENQNPSWVWCETGINYISSGFGCFSLLLIWWVAHIVLAFT